MAEPNLHACAYFVIRVAADPLRDEAVNVGVALYHLDGELVGVHLNPDWSRVRCLNPLFDPAELAGLEVDLARALREKRDYTLGLAQETFSHGLRFTPPTLVLTADPASELELLYRRYAAPPPALPARGVALGARRGILRHLQQVFRQERVEAHLQRNLRIGDLVDGDPGGFRFDFHYRPNGVHHCLQALPLAGAEASVSELCFTFQRLRRLLGERGIGFDLAAFAEVPALASASPRAYHRRLLEEAGVRVLELAEAPAEAGRIRAALHLG